MRVVFSWGQMGVLASINTMTSSIACVGQRVCGVFVAKKTGGCGELTLNHGEIKSNVYCGLCCPCRFLGSLIYGFFCC